MNLDDFSWVASSWVKEKLAMRNISFEEVEEAAFNASPPYAIENRMGHLTDPLSRWFIAPTVEGRLLKVVFIPYVEKRIVVVKTAYEPDENEVTYYEQY